ncbi:MAG: regulatory iron-sulfur-containing complex subunit RicT [Parcubacteria group bacterium]
MRVAEVQFTPWDKIYDFDPNGFDVATGDYVIVETKIGVEMGRVAGFTELSESDLKALPEPLKPIARKASQDDLDIVLKQNQKKTQAFSECRRLIKKTNLPIKLVDAHFSFDDTRITFAFIADGRVDFRELLKELNRHFKKNIRLQQLGIRDEIKMSGDTGYCGRNLCCQSFYKELGNVTSDLAEMQQVAHRGPDRLSGVCGRLKCCLTFEKDLYNELAAKMPAVGSKIKTTHGKGEVIGWHVLKQTVDVLLEDKETILEVPIEK